MPPQMIPELKFIIRAIGFKAAQDIAKQAMGFVTGTEVEKFAQERLAEILK
jgi:hypothetical protein